MSRLPGLAVCAAVAAIGLAAMEARAVIAAEPTHPVLRASSLPPLLPTRTFLGGRSQSWAYRISPDGTRLAWFERDRPSVLLRIRNIDNGGEKTIRLRRPGGRLTWAYDNRRLLFTRDWRGDENDRLFVLDTEDSDAVPKILTPRRGVKAVIRQMLPDDPAGILIAMNDRDRTVFDLYRLDIRTGAMRRVAENPGDVMRWVVNERGHVLARYRRLKDGDWAFEARGTALDHWKPLLRGGFDQRHSIPFASRDGRWGWGFSELSRDRTAVVRIDLRNGREEVLYGHPAVEVDSLWFDWEAEKPLMALIRPGYPELHFFDRKLAADLALFRTDGPAEIRVIGRSRDSRRLIVRVSTDTTHRTFYLFDRATRKKTLLAADPITRHKDALSPMKPVSFEARDGLKLRGYLTVPRGTKGRNLPMVLKVHGGPWVRDYWQYDQVTQFLANRGYAVLAVNYRGSSGYGRAFRQAIRRQYARKAHDDVIDGVNWAIAQGIADPARVAIYGRSYGGYETLVGLTFTPDVFAAGVDIVGMSALVGNKSRTAAYRKLDRHWREYVGDARKPEDRADMAARSPINFVDRIRSPLLVVHGVNDVRVPVENSNRLVAAMRKAGKPVEYLLFDDEGHQLRRPRNRLKMLRHIEAFLARHLGGRSAE